MLKAKTNGTLGDKNQRVYVDKNEVKWFSGAVSLVLRAFRRRDTAEAAMAHTWAKVASSKNGMTRQQILREIDSVEDK